jgi:carbonic anhydrase/acetyltransferase-like protein (isoleucine patch superfamily)
LPIESFEAFSPRVHPSAFIHPGAYLIGEVEVGEEASIWPGATLRGDHGGIVIGARTSIQDGAIAHATHAISQTVIGAECTVGHRAVLHGCRVGDHCLVGMGAILMDNAELGEWCFLAAGALVPPGKVYPPRSFLLGTPARRLREITAEEERHIGYAWRAYQDLAQRYRARGPSGPGS